MWIRGPRGRWAAVVAAAVLAAGCAGQQGTASWPAELAEDLVPTGWLLWGGTGSGDIVVDGAGMAWVDGPWQVARIDPATGQGRVWDATADAAFASVAHLAPAQPEGVWLVADDTARLFDGERFVAVLGLPPMPAQPDADQQPTRDLLQVGQEVWVSGTDGVSRWADGSWSAMAPDQLVEAGPLARDSEGAVWAGGQVVAADGSRVSAPVRWDPDGQSWQTPAASASTPGGRIEDLAADPAGGVWVLSSGEGTDDHGVFHFDGTAWSRVGPGGYAFDLSVTASGQVWAMASMGGGVDGSGGAEASLLAADGTWQAHGAEQGAPVADELGWVRLASAGDRVLLGDDEGVLVSQGEAGAERFVRLWGDPSAVVKVWPGTPGSLLATSADEAYVVAQPRGADANDSRQALLRRRDFEWVRVGNPVPGDLQAGPVLASDGAVWTVTVDGLARAAGDAWEVVDPEVDPWNPPSLAAGPAGSVWMVRDGGVVRVAPDGTRTSIGRPKGVRPLWAASPLASSGEVVWVAAPNGPIHRWDGSWTTLPLPGGALAVTRMAGAGDGSLWVLASAEDRDLGLARYGDEQWTSGPSDAQDLAAGPDDTMCTIRTTAADVACFDASMVEVRTLPVGARLRAVSVAPDGAVWVLGEQVARLTPGR